MTTGIFVNQLTAIDIGCSKMKTAVHFTIC